MAPAKDAADAARLNAQAVVDADRARIFVRVEEDNTNALFPSAGLMEGSDSAPIRFHIALTYTLKNHGKTPAIIKEISHQIIHADKLQKTRDYILVEPLPIEHVLDAGDRTERLRCEMDSFLTVGNAKSIKSSKSSLWFYGSVAYDDTFGWGRELRYVFNYDGDTAGRFRLCSFREFESQKRNERQKA